MTAEYATKTELRTLVGNLANRIIDVRVDMAAIEHRLEAKIDALDRKVTVRIDALEKTLLAAINRRNGQA